MRYRRVFQPGATYFFTVVTHLRRPLFADPASVDLLHRCIAGGKLHHPFEIDAFVILPDHLHMLWSLPESDTGYSMRWNLIKAMFTRNYALTQPMPSRSASRIAKREQAVWQRRFWEHLIRDEEDFSNHLDYIHLTLTTRLVSLSRHFSSAILDTDRSGLWSSGKNRGMWVTVVRAYWRNWPCLMSRFACRCHSSPQSRGSRG
jgi:putative transposase